MADPMPFDRDDWRRRWMRLSPRGQLLHRVSSIEWATEDRLNGSGVTVCGRRGRLHLPGVLSRLDATRCSRCCAALGIPAGDGAPYNDERLGEAERDA